MKSSIIAAVSAVSLAAAAIRKSKPRETQEPSISPASKTVTAPVADPIGDLGLELVDLNEASREELIELDGLEPGVVERIIRMRPFHDRADVTRKLGMFFRWHQPAEAKAAA